MFFINRENERNSFKISYEKNIQNNISQVYIIEANHGVGKSEFIREVSKFFFNYPLEIFQSDVKEELSIFKRLVLELDKTSGEYGYDDFKTFYRKKTNNAKAMQLLLKITAVFGQAWAKSKNFDVKLTSLIDTPIESEKFILNAQIENMFEYSKYVFTTMHMHIIFHHALIIDSGSLDLLSKLIATSKGCVFVFESDNDESSSRIEQYLQNSHSIFFRKYLLKKLSNVHLQSYIEQILYDLKLKANYIDSSILKESIEKGDLTEILSILKDFNDRLQKDTSAKIRSAKEILQSLPEEQSALLILIGYSNGKLNFIELREILNELGNSFNMLDTNSLMSRNLIEKNNDYISLSPFVYEIFKEKEYMPFLKHVVASALIKNLNIKLIQNYNNRYVDILVDYYLRNKQFSQLKSLLQQISQRLKKFNTQAERIDYFKKFNTNRWELYRNDANLAIKFSKIAYDANLYFEAMNFIDLVGEVSEETFFIKALILNRCEHFIQSKNYINSKLKKINKKSSTYFKLSLVLIMNLIQLNERNEAKVIYTGIAISLFN